MNMKKLEKYAIILLILWILQSIIGRLATMIYFSVSSLHQMADLSLWHQFSGYTFIFLKQMANILIGIWLFVIAKKEKEGTPWFWLMLGIFGGILAPLLYFILRIYQSVKCEKAATGGDIL